MLLMLYNVANVGKNGIATGLLGNADSMRLIHVLNRKRVIT